MIGTNLIDVRDYGVSYPFNDLVKTARTKTSANELLWAFQDDFPGGVYTVSYTGSGTLSYPSNITELGANTIEFQAGKRNTIIKMNGDVNDLQIRKAEGTFNPDFLASLRGRKILRFMDWQRTNNSESSTWEERPLPTDIKYTSDKGVPIEILILLANITNISPWFCIPHKADDNYIRKFAELVKSELDPNITCYVEYSNEVWNGQFTQNQYSMDQGKDLNTNKYLAGHLWYGQRVAEVAAIWKDVLGGQVQCVMSNQATSLYNIEKSYDNNELNIDVISSAPYFGNKLGISSNEAEVETWDLDRLFQELNDVLLPYAINNMNNYQDFADSKGLKYIPYEAGQHLAAVGSVRGNQKIIDLFIAANRDQRMGDLYTKYLKAFKGGIICLFTDFGTATEYGQWGLSEGLYKPASYKSLAVEAFIGNEPEPEKNMKELFWNKVDDADHYVVEVGDEESIVPQQEGNEITIPLASLVENDGIYTISIWTVDVAGNNSTEALTLTGISIDTTPPEAPEFGGVR